MSNSLNTVNQILTSVSSAEDVLKTLSDVFPIGVVFSTSFGYEDQIITDIILRDNLPIKIFTLDTGRNFPETYSTWSATNERYNTVIESYNPQTDAVQKMLSEKGPNSFYLSVENRKECCGIRKLEPLGRALSGQLIWITGIRAEQSVNRKDMQATEWDNAHQLVKVHPLFDWSLAEVKDYIKQYNVPYNPLHDRGLPSIGCQPCTRAVREGENFRSGRWWWENTNDGKQECGLHNN